MAIRPMFLLFCGLASSAMAQQPSYEVARQEAARLREAYQQWQLERPRKIEFWSVPERILSAEAKAVGLCDATVDSETVVFVTGSSTKQVEGLVFGNPSAAWVQRFKSAGFVLHSAGAEGIVRFSHPRPEPSVKWTPRGKPQGAPDVER